MSFLGRKKASTNIGWLPIVSILNGLTAAAVLLLLVYASLYLRYHFSTLLTKKIEKPDQFLLSLGSADIADIKAHKIKVDILDQYFVAVVEAAWASWSSAQGDCIQALTES